MRPRPHLRALRARLRLARRLAWRRRQALAIVMGVFFYGQMALAEAGAHWTVAFDPQTHRSLADGVLYLVEHDAGLPARGDVVAFTPPTDAAALFPEPERVRFMKRVAGLPGDRVVIGGGSTRVNGVVVARGLDLAPFLKADRALFERTLVVPQGAFFPVGDTRDSFDGRYYGVVSDDAIVGRARSLW
jgi:conjugal transfer pilin signal peptidase TrbI